MRVYTVYCYEDMEIKGVFATEKEASQWVHQNRDGDFEIAYIQSWDVQKEETE